MHCMKRNTINTLFFFISNLLFSSPDNANSWWLQSFKISLERVIYWELTAVQWKAPRRILKSLRHILLWCKLVLSIPEPHLILTYKSLSSGCYSLSRNKSMLLEEKYKKTSCTWFNILLWQKTVPLSLKEIAERIWFSGEHVFPQVMRSCYFQ